MNQKIEYKEQKNRGMAKETNTLRCMLGDWNLKNAGHFLWSSTTMPFHNYRVRQDSLTKKWVSEGGCVVS
jgi:hypothetical protein